MSTKEFSLDRISHEKAINWITKAIKKKAKKIIVSYSSSHLCPHNLLPGEDEAESINDVICSHDLFVGVIDVEEAKSILKLY